jgi:hypothetical protein
MLTLFLAKLSETTHVALWPSTLSETTRKFRGFQGLSMPLIVDRLESVSSFLIILLFKLCLFQKDKLWEEEKNVFFEKCKKRLHKFLEYRLPVAHSDIGWESLHRAKLVQALQTDVQADLSAARCLEHTFLCQFS